MLISDLWTDVGRGFSVGVLGVQFVWNKPEKHRDLLTEIGHPVLKVIGQVRQATKDTCKRQKRRDLVYWDVMTFFEGWSGFRRKEYKDNHKLLLKLCHSIAQQRMDDPAVFKLWGHSKLQKTAPVYSVFRGRGISKHANAMARTNPRCFSLGPDGYWKVDPPVPFRQIALYLGEAPARVTKSYIMHLCVLAALLNLRADIEIFYETGLMRLARCQRAACRSWYATKPMTSRRKFCCESCRVMHFREK